MKPLVLVADDDADVRLLFRISLQRNGFDVMEAADGSQALNCAFQSAPAVILLDAMMPEVDSVKSVVNQGRRRTVHPGIVSPVIRFAQHLLNTAYIWKYRSRLSRVIKFADEAFCVQV